MTRKETTHSSPDLSSFETIPVLNGETLAVLKSLEKPGDKISFLDDLIDTFIRETPGVLKLVLDAARARNLIALKHNAHQLKGLAGNIGVEKLAAFAEWLEIEAENGSIPEAEELKAVLDSFRAQAIESLKSEWKR